jgi:5S rRNA maturation endonuclease (ribonuclease M5)
MTITQRLTRRGNAIHLVSSSDLVGAVQYGERLRAYCPIHGSDHQRSLSIDLATGWGFCHSCHATVLVPSMASVIASEQGNSYGQRCAHSGSGGTNTAQWAQPAVRASLVGQVRTTTSLPHWQQEEVAALTTMTLMMHEALASSQRVQRYFVERNLPHTLALATGVGYLSRTAWEEAPVSQEQQQLLKRWVGRIIFPLGSPGGQGFIGRTLLKWEPGMNENAHKALLDQPGAPRRWIKTNPAGWFGFDEPACLAEWVVLVEGGFDRLALLAAGLPANAVIALVGTAARPSWLARLAPQVKRVLVALDSDNGGAVAMERLTGEFRQAGYMVTQCPPSQDQWGKDWSERFRRLGPQSLWPLYDAYAHAHAVRADRR